MVWQPLLEYSWFAAQEYGRIAGMRVSLLADLISARSANGSWNTTPIMVGALAGIAAVTPFWRLRSHTSRSNSGVPGGQNGHKPLSGSNLVNWAP